ERAALSQPKDYLRARHSPARRDHLAALVVTARPAALAPVCYSPVGPKARVRYVRRSLVTLSEGPLALPTIQEPFRESTASGVAGDESPDCCSISLSRPDLAADLG